MVNDVGKIWYSIYDEESHEESVIADHLADNTIKDYEPLNFDFSDEDVLVVQEERELNWWTMYFDRVVNVYDNGAGIMIISPKKKQYAVSIKL